MRNLRQEYIHAQNEVKRIASIPLMIGHFLEGIDPNTCIVAPTSGQNYYVRLGFIRSLYCQYDIGQSERQWNPGKRILSTVDREKLKPSAAVCLHKHSHSLVDVLPPESDSSIQDSVGTIFDEPFFSVNPSFRWLNASRRLFFR